MRQGTNCLPEGAFGASVRRLALSWRDGPVPSKCDRLWLADAFSAATHYSHQVAVLKQATLWAELHDIHVYERFNAPTPTRKDAPACPITLVLLSQLPSRDTLREITITVSPRCSRAARRTQFLHALGNSEGMDEFLSSFTNLASLHFDISAPDGQHEHDGDWWQGMLSDHFQKVRTKVLLSVRVHKNGRHSRRVKVDKL